MAGLRDGTGRRESGISGPLRAFDGLSKALHRIAFGRVDRSPIAGQHPSQSGHLSEAVQVDPSDGGFAPKLDRSALACSGLPDLLCRPNPAEAQHHIPGALASPQISVGLSAEGQLAEVVERVALPGAAAGARGADEAGPNIRGSQDAAGEGQQRRGGVGSERPRPAIDLLLFGVTGDHGCVLDSKPHRSGPFLQGAHKLVSDGLEHTGPSLSEPFAQLDPLVVTNSDAHHPRHPAKVNEP